MRIADALLEREVLEGSEVIDLINGKPLSKVAGESKPTAPPDGGIVVAPHPTGGSMPGLVGGESPQPA